MDGAHTLVPWHTLHSCVVGICLKDFPVATAYTPLWQLEQLPTAMLWVNVEGFHTVVRWQTLQSCVVGMCVVADLPVA